MTIQGTSLDLSSQGLEMHQIWDLLDILQHSQITDLNLSGNEWRAHQFLFLFSHPYIAYLTSLNITNCGLSRSQQSQVLGLVRTIDRRNLTLEVVMEASPVATEIEKILKENRQLESSKPKNLDKIKEMLLSGLNKENKPQLAQENQSKPMVTLRPPSPVEVAKPKALSLRDKQTGARSLKKRKF